MQSAAEPIGLCVGGKPWAQVLLCTLMLCAAAPVFARSCVWNGVLPCAWGECVFNTNATGFLVRSGNCSARSDERLCLDRRGITGLSDGVFDDVGAVSLVLSNNMLTSLPAGVFDSLMELEHLYLDNNVLSSLPAGIFDALTKLQVLCTVMMKPLE
jgi:hypothetical protein